MLSTFRALKHLLYIFLLFGILGRTSTAIIIIVSTVIIVPLQRSPDKLVRRFKDVPVGIGPLIDFERPVTGYVSVAEPIDACVDSLPLPGESNASALNYISLVKDGNCSLVRKIHAAEIGGYIAAIIYGKISDIDNPVRNMSDLLNISAVFIRYSDGEEIRYNYSNKHYIVEIFPDMYYNIGIYLIPLATCVFIFIVGGVSIYVYRCWDQHNRRRRCCLPSSQLKRLRLLTFTKDMTSYETCAICLEDYSIGDKLRVLPCDHAYHSKCIDPWLVKRRRVCPICKKKLRRRLRCKRSILKRRSRRTASHSNESQYLLDSSVSSDEGDNLSQNAAQSPNESANNDRHRLVLESDDLTPNEHTPLLSQHLDYSSNNNSNTVAVDNFHMRFDELQEMGTSVVDETVEAAKVMDQKHESHTSSVSTCLPFSNKVDKNLVSETKNHSPQPVRTQSHHSGGNNVTVVELHQDYDPSSTDNELLF